MKSLSLYCTIVFIAFVSGCSSERASVTSAPVPLLSPTGTLRPMTPSPAVAAPVQTAAVSRPSPTMTPTYPTSTFWLERILRDQPCHIPCWEGITPGETTQAEVRERLKEIPWVKLTDPTARPLMFTLADSSINQYRGVGGSIDFEKAPPYRIATISFFANVTFAWDTVRSTFGEPHDIMAYVSQQSEDMQLWYSYEVILIYPEHKMLVSAHSLLKPRLIKDIVLDGLILLAPGTDYRSWSSFREHAAQGGVIRRWEGDLSFDYYCSGPAKDTQC